MSFRRQQGWTILAGGLAVALALIFTALRPDAPGLPLADWVATILAPGGLILLIALFRAVHRVMWLGVFRGNPSYNESFATYGLRGPLRHFWQWWLHVDQKGNDLDA